MRKFIRGLLGYPYQCYKVSFIEINLFLCFPGWVGGWSSGELELKLKPTQFNLNLNCLFKLSLAMIQKISICFGLALAGGVRALWVSEHTLWQTQYFNNCQAQFKQAI